MVVAESVELFWRVLTAEDVTVTVVTAVISDLESTPLTAIVYVPALVGVHVNVFVADTEDVLPSEVVN